MNIKNAKIAGSLLLIWSCCLMSFSKVNLNEVFYGPTIRSIDMHNAQIGGAYNPEEYRMFANSWRKSYDVTISVPVGWHFVGEPSMHCVKDDRGSFGWNDFGKSDHFYVVEKNPRYIKARVWIGSRSIEVNMQCAAEKE